LVVGVRPVDGVLGPVGGGRDEAVQAAGAGLGGGAVHGMDEDVAGDGDDEVVDLYRAHGLDGVAGLAAGVVLVLLEVGDGHRVLVVEGLDEAGAGVGGGLVRGVPHRVPLGAVL